jgi:hypothetical protein
MKTKNSGCKFAMRYGKDKIQCTIDGSIRTVGNGCPCKVYVPSFWSKIKNIFNNTK